MGASRVQDASTRLNRLHSVLSYKRLERGRFRLPEIRDDQTEVELDATQLAMLLDGIDIKRVPPPRRWMPPRREKLDAIPRS